MLQDMVVQPTKSTFYSGHKIKNTSRKKEKNHNYSKSTITYVRGELLFMFL